MADETTTEMNAPSAARRPPRKPWVIVLYTVLAIIAVVVLFVMMTVFSGPKPEQREIRADEVGGLGKPYVRPPGETPPPPDQRPTSVVAKPGSAPEGQPGIIDRFIPDLSVGGGTSVPIKHYQAPSSLVSQAGPGTTQRVAETSSAAQISAGNGDALDQKLGAADNHGVSVATMLPDPHMFLTVGTGMPCISEQPIDTDVPGIFNCFVRGGVMGHSGAVTLIEDGTKITGRISESLGRGKRRAFGVVTRVATPKGCIINLRAPIGDQLGVSGVDGEVDNHFFERFRGVAILALFDAASQAAAIAASNAIGGDNGISFNQLETGGRSLGEGTAGDDINIPPTLKRAQAKRMLIMINEDIDMRACYKLRVAR
jgi:type IV secretion system protein VirB10